MENRRNPIAANKEYLLTKDSPFLVQEAYRTLRTNIMFSLPGTGCKTIGVSSPMPGDGKSTTAASLAVALAQIGKKVLLIDCDMRIPTVASKFHITPAPGLSDFLTGQAKVEETVRKLEDAGIHVMPAGNLPPDPTGLLEAKQLEHLFTALRSIYDFVVVDLPPVITVPDAAILSRYIDGYLMVIREKKTRHKDVGESLKRLELAEANVVGFVTTGTLSGTGDYYASYRK